jgi:beta-galactosidase/beta-glucuronidase
MEFYPNSNYGFAKSKEEVVDEDNPLPRAVLRSNSYQLLDGEWKFAIDSADEGLTRGWHIGHNYTQTANWPGSIENYMENSKDYTQPWHGKIVAWYEREFSLPTENSGSQLSMWQLTLGACGYETQVWLNGFAIKTIEGEEIHIGEYTSFSYELNQEILKPVNRITVRISDTMDANIPRGKQESVVFKRGGIWYRTHTGAVRSIWVEKVERNRLRSRVGVVSVVEDDLVRFNLTTRIHDPGNYTIRLKVFERKQQSNLPIAEADFPLTLEAGQKQQRVVMEVPGIKLWSPDTPNMYTLIAQLTGGEESVSQI